MRTTPQCFWSTILLFYGLACAVSWFIWSPYYRSLDVPVGWLPYVHGLGSLGPMLAALVLTGYQTGPAGLRRLLENVLTRRSVRWLVIGALSPVVVLLGVISLVYVTHRQLPSGSAGLIAPEFASVSPWVVVAINLFCFGFGEEVGWRGYVLPRLQARYSAFTANLILTGGWAVWHWPLFVNPLGNLGQMNFGEGIGWLLSLVTGGMLFTWLFNTSRGNWAACALFHGSMDLVFLADLGLPVVSSYTGAIVTLWGLWVWFAYGRSSLSVRPRVRETPIRPRPTVRA